MANGVAPEKVELIRSYGGQPLFHGANPVDAEYKAREVANATARSLT